jgi:competence protein ComEC
LGVILFVTQNLSPRSRLIIGAIALTIYVGLTGVQASILRAGLMGLGGLVALTQERKVDPLRGLLLAAVIILIYNPLFLRDIGFQLSFAATLGLMTTLPYLQQRLDWMPTPIATMIAIPIAASLWTMPLLLHHFSGFSLYSIPLNIGTGPLILVISLGGMISAFGGLVYPPFGSLIATVLTWPIKVLMAAVTFSNSLPLSDFATGKSPLWLTLGIYVVMVVLWLSPRLKPHRRLILFTLGSILLVAMFGHKLTLLQVTILPSGNNPLIVVEQQTNTILFGSPDDQSDRYTLQPFLRYRGINHIDCHVKFDPDPSYNCAGHSLDPDRPSTPYQTLSKNFTLGQVLVQNLDPALGLIQLQMGKHQWLLFTKPLTDQSQLYRSNPQAEVVAWRGNYFPFKWFKQLKPQITIAMDQRWDNLVKGSDFYYVARDGAIQWNGRKGVVTHSQVDYGLD